MKKAVMALALATATFAMAAPAEAARVSTVFSRAQFLSRTGFDLRIFGFNNTGKVEGQFSTFRRARACRQGSSRCAAVARVQIPTFPSEQTVTMFRKSDNAVCGAVTILYDGAGKGTLSVAQANSCGGSAVVASKAKRKTVASRKAKRKFFS